MFCLPPRSSIGVINSFTFIYESKKAFPANGRLVAEIYDQMQTFNAPFELKDISLLGTPIRDER